METRNGTPQTSLIDLKDPNNQEWLNKPNVLLVQEVGFLPTEEQLANIDQKCGWQTEVPQNNYDDYKKALGETRYVVDLDRTLGRGGMGQVYLGWDWLLGKEVAVKELFFGTEEADQKRLELEAKTLAQINDPGVVGFCAFINNPDTNPLLIMEYLGEGWSKAAEFVCDLRDNRTRDKLIRIVNSVGATIDRMAGIGLFHGDIVPSNIFYSEEGTKLIDFGMSNWALLPGDVHNIGWLIYAAPEKIRKHATTVESEVYSLAACVFTFLAGKSPFWRRDENKSDLDEAVKIVQYPGLDSDLMKKRGWRDEEIEGLNDIFKKSFDVDPEKRFRSATELAQSFERAMVS